MDILSKADAVRIVAPDNGRLQQRRTAPVSTVRVASPAASAPAITIERLILHHLDNHAADPLLVDAELALDGDIRALFASYIAEAHQNADWRARFYADASDASDATPTMPDLCAQLLHEPAAFVAISQEMARRLFAQMRQRPNQINPGDFVLALYTAPMLPTACIALFKLDPDARLVRDFSVERGRRLARIALADNLMPQTVRLKQKCALITPAADGADFAVALLDTQANIRSDGVAVYFYRGFLATRILPSARRRTRLFLRATDDWLAAHSAALAPQALMRFYAARRAALAGETLDLPAFTSAAVPADSALAADLLAWLIPQIFDAEFEPHQTRFTVDRATADPIVRFVTLELDGGARLRIPAE
ncbi:MAG TPA: nucleoid-associated protein, partial [Ktedonobacterales bacterium]|nr:nucleoid-associated protein [Ktedonobacterales bacterium]